MTRGDAVKSHRRTFLFQLTTSEEVDSSKMVAFTAKIPVLPRYSDDIEKEDMESNRAALVSIVNGLWRNPRLCVPAATWLMQRLASTKRSKHEHFFRTVPASLRLLDEEYLVDFLTKHSALTKPCLESLSIHDPDSNYQLLASAMSCSLNLKLPEQCVDQRFCSILLTKLLADRGDRLQKLTDKMVKEGGNGGVNWMGDAGPYQLDFNENGILQSVLHRKTGDVAVLPEFDRVHESMSLCKPWGDMECFVDKKTSDLYIWKLFDEDKGPRSSAVLTSNSKPMTMAIEDATASFHDLTALVALASQSSGKKFKADHYAAIARKSIGKARQAFEKRKVDLKAKRTVNLKAVAAKKKTT